MTFTIIFNSSAICSLRLKKKTEMKFAVVNHSSNEVHKWEILL